MELKFANQSFVEELKEKMEENDRQAKEYEKAVEEAAIAKHFQHLLEEITINKIKKQAKNKKFEDTKRKRKAANKSRARNR